MQKSPIVLTCAMVGLLLVQGVRAQSAGELIRAHRYTEAIEKLRGEEDGEKLFQLGQARRLRGYFLRDLARLQAHLGTLYYTRRDTSAAARSTKWEGYFAARHRIAAGMDGGMKSLRRMLRRESLPAEYQSRAQVWIGLLQHRAGNRAAAKDTWASVSGKTPGLSADRALAHWWAGESLPSLQCGEEEGPAALRCALWEALRKEDWKRVAEVQRSLLSEPRPADETATFEEFSVRYYDPGTLRVLAIADFRAAAAAFRRVTGDQQSRASLLAGVCALEGKDYQAARTAFGEASRSALGGASRRLAVIYRAALQQEAGNGEKSRSLWRKARQNGNSAMLAIWAQEAALYESQRAAVRSHLERSVQNPPGNMNEALRLGRAALGIDAPQMAYSFLEAAYPTAQSNDLRAIKPAYLTVISHAKSRVGARYREEVLRHLNALREEYPIASVVDELARGFYVPEDTYGRSRSGG